MRKIVERACVILLIWIPFLVAAQPGDASSAGEETRFKVMSYNLRFGELASMEEFAEFIKTHDPDIVALQEVDNRTFRERAPQQNDIDFATELGYHTGMIPAYGKTIPYRGGYYGIGILSKYPLAKVERIYLPKTENGKEQRAILVAEVEYEEGEYVTFASTHLDYTNTEERQVQVRKLNEDLTESPYPVIIGGDFNGRPESLEIREAMKDWKLVSSLDPSVPADKTRNTIDYILCYPKDRWERIENQTYKIDMSDHLSISAVIELKN